MRYLIFILTLTFTLNNFSVRAGGACTGSPNNSCANAITLTVGAACVSGSTCDAGASATVNTTCTTTQPEAVWYKFVATATSMIVDIQFVSGGCYFASGVFSGTCASLTQIGCQVNAPLDDIYSLTGLTIGNTYFIQISYPPGGPCGTDADFCIAVDIPTPPCPTCAAPCGTAIGYPATPSVATVVADCTTNPFAPPLAAGSTHTFCYDFQATATSVDFNVIITSDCGAGNVTAFSWQLFNATCGAPIMSGTLASLTFSPVVVGNNYVFCYTFTVPAGCTHSQHCPYFVGATVLPIQLLSFNADYIDNKVDLTWTTASEENNDFFTVERTTDGIDFEKIAIIKGSALSNQILSYEAFDIKPHYGISYYRLKQTDYDGTIKYSNLIPVTINNNNESFVVFPNPAGNNAEISFNADFTNETILNIMDATGRLILTRKVNAEKGINNVKLETGDFIEGIYFVTLTNKFELLKTKFVKD